jgi:lipoprotein-releasing system permease protein
MAARTGTLPFAPFEWMLSLRYLRARRKEGFISVIAGFSFLGIMLGVATLIIVMAVMNGFRKELMSKILGINGHILVQPLESALTDYAEVAKRISAIKGVTLAVPLVEGQALASSPFQAGGVLVRGVREEDLRRLPAISSGLKAGTLEGFDKGQGVLIGKRLAARRGDADGHDAAHQVLQGRGAVRDRHVGIRPSVRLHAARGSAGLFQPAGRCQRDRGLYG